VLGDYIQRHSRLLDNSNPQYLSADFIVNCGKQLFKHPKGFFFILDQRVSLTITTQPNAIS